MGVVFNIAAIQNQDEQLTPGSSGNTAKPLEISCSCVIFIQKSKTDKPKLVGGMNGFVNPSKDPSPGKG